MKVDLSCLFDVEGRSSTLLPCRQALGIISVKTCPIDQIPAKVTHLRLRKKTQLGGRVRGRSVLDLMCSDRQASPKLLFLRGNTGLSRLPERNSQPFGKIVWKRSCSSTYEANPLITGLRQALVAGSDRNSLSKYL